MRNETKDRGRRFLRPLVKLLNRWAISPSAVTWSALPLSIVAGILFAMGNFVWGGVAAMLVGLCDTVDGELSRMSGRTSVSGAILDSTVDRLSEGIILTGIALYYQKVNGVYSVLAMIAMLFSLLVSYVRARAEGAGRQCQVGFFERPIRVIILVFSAIVLGRRLLPLGLGVIAVGSLVTFIHRLVHVLKSQS
ncbi:MAG: CDP-alcohol phosphatidyltransferase family protein [candidate division WOR-3 bacterium]